jgi:pimeloyl-ACP methyl ester carboxylesterase
MGWMLKAREMGEGPRLLLFHGAAAPEVGWELQEALSERLLLIVPWRRGYGDSPAADQQDFEADAEDILELLDTHSAHAAAYSYGAIGLLVAASKRPNLFQSLTLIEPPLFQLAHEDESVQQLMGQLGELMQKGPDGAPAELQDFVRLGKLAGERGFPPPPPMRSPGEAEIDYDEIRDEEGLPVLVVSGDHHPGFERTCDALAERLGAEREVVPGFGHAPQRADGFNEKFEAFVTRASAPLA